MKTWLAFGDSNTHGTVPAIGGEISFERHPEGIRWPTVALPALGPGWRLVEDGLPGRTTRFPDPVMGDHMDGRDGLKSALMAHARVDLISIMLGTNDLKFRFGATAETVAAGIGGLLDILRAPDRVARLGLPTVLLIAPPPVDVVGPRAVEWLHARDKALKLAPLFEEVARAYGVAFLDAGSFISVAPEEGIHWSAEAHARFGKAAGAALSDLSR